MSQQLEKINNMFDTIESKIIGGSNDTEPYNTFRSGLNSIYDYFSVIFVSNKENNENYQASVDNLDKSCDCSKYKCKEGNTQEEDDDDINDIDENHDIEELKEEKEEKEEEEEKENQIEKKSKLLLKTSKIL
jgi:hypothetical protein